MDQVIAIVQARMRSERLPGKILADLAGRPLIARVIERLQAVPGIDRVVLAVPREDLPHLCGIAAECGVQLHPGSANNVLQRYYTAASRYPAPYVIRVTGDNPLIETGQLARCIQACRTGLWDMVGCRNLPLGAGAEVFPASLLDLLRLFGREPYHREHVTCYLYEHETEFRVCRLDPPRPLRRPELRLTVDTRQDLELMQEIYRKLQRPGQMIELAEAIRLLDQEPQLKSLNAGVPQRSWRPSAELAQAAV